MAKCKKCLLLEAGENVTYSEIMSYVNTINKNDLTDESVYFKRISFCKECEYLISGMCVKCGCYVEVRARLKNSNCPNYDNRKW